jgi:catechol 2,3-dioxygenase-like lactoylglutathione lyase family enzyme
VTIANLEQFPEGSFMFTSARPFSGFSVDDIAAAKKFYGDTLGVPVVEDHGMLRLQVGEGYHVLVYPKEGHTPATFTILNFRVDNIESAVDDLVKRGVVFQHYEGTGSDEKEISRDGGPPIAWFTDPAGNILSVIQE